MDWDVQTCLGRLPIVVTVASSIVALGREVELTHARVTHGAAQPARSVRPIGCCCRVPARPCDGSEAADHCPSKIPRLARQLQVKLSKNKGKPRVVVNQIPWLAVAGGSGALFDGVGTAAHAAAVVVRAALTLLAVVLSGAVFVSVVLIQLPLLILGHHVQLRCSSGSG